MAEKLALSRHYKALVNQLSSFNNPALESLQAYFSQLFARLNPEAGLNPKINCPGCCTVRTGENHDEIQESPINKKERRREKQIRKLRRVKNRTKKQENMLKKLLMCKQGCLKITCKLCGHVVKLPSANVDFLENIKSVKRSSNQQIKTKKDFHQETILKKKEKKKTAGLNPLYVKPKVSTPVEDKFVPNTFNKTKNVQKLSQMLQNKNKKPNSNRLDLLLE